MKQIDPGVLSIGMSNHDLCTRCGTCGGACPTEAISITGASFPKLIPELCTECGLCRRVCPGDSVEYTRLTELTFGHRRLAESFDGHTRATYVGHASDSGLRARGAGGGVITALLWDLLKHGDVDGCLVTRMRRDKPWLGEYFIARSYEELLSSQGSRYLIIPMNRIFTEVRRLPGRYAYAALPCQVHGYRLLAEEDPALRSKIHCVIGLFCGGSLEPNVVTELLRARGIDPEDIQDFRFRGGEWPGKMRAVMKSGEIVDLHPSNYKDGAYNYFTLLYSPERCQTCLDGSGEFADVAVSDAWTRDDQGDYRFAAHSRLLARTELGFEVMRRAIARGSLIAHDVSEDPAYRTHRIQTKRKGLNAPLRVARRLRKGRPAPIYDRPVPEATLRELWTERLAAFVLWLGKFYWFRYPLMKFLTSDMALPLIHLRLYLKKRRYRKKSDRGGFGVRALLAAGRRRLCPRP